MSDPFDAVLSNPRTESGVHLGVSTGPHIAVPVYIGADRTPAPVDVGRAQNHPTGRHRTFMETHASGQDVGDAILQLQGSINTLMDVLTPEQKEKLRDSQELKQSTAQLERRLSPWTKIWKALAAIAVAVGTVFGAGAAYQKIIGDNATKADIQAHVERDLNPVKAQVEQIEQDLQPVKSGVESLVAQQAKEKKVEKMQRRLDRYDREYQQSLEEYARDKESGRRGAPRPRKTKEQLDLEEDLAEAAEEL